MHAHKHPCDVRVRVTRNTDSVTCHTHSHASPVALCLMNDGRSTCSLRSHQHFRRVSHYKLCWLVCRDDTKPAYTWAIDSILTRWCEGSDGLVSSDGHVSSETGSQTDCAVLSWCSVRSIDSCSMLPTTSLALPNFWFVERLENDLRLRTLPWKSFINNKNKTK